MAGAATFPHYVQNSEAQNGITDLVLAERVCGGCEVVGCVGVCVPEISFGGWLQLGSAVHVCTTFGFGWAAWQALHVHATGIIYIGKILFFYH